MWEIETKGEKEGLGVVSLKKVLREARLDIVTPYGILVVTHTPIEAGVIGFYQFGNSVARSLQWLSSVITDAKFIPGLRQVITWQMKKLALASHIITVRREILEKCLDIAVDIISHWRLSVCHNAAAQWRKACDCRRSCGITYRDW